MLRSLGVSETVDKLPCLLLEWCASDLKRALQLELVALADGKTRSLRSRISGGTKWLGLRSKSKSPKFGSDRKQFFPDDAVARPHP